MAARPGRRAGRARCALRSGRRARRPDARPTRSSQARTGCPARSGSGCSTRWTGSASPTPCSRCADRRRRRRSCVGAAAAAQPDRRGRRAARRRRRRGALPAGAARRSPNCSAGRAIRRRPVSTSSWPPTTPSLARDGRGGRRGRGGGAGRSIRGDDPAAHLRRAVHWRRYARGPVNALHRSCGADIARGSLRLLAGARRR